jgi:hypothetical protein
MLDDGQFLKIRSHGSGVEFELCEVVLQHGYRATYVLPHYFFEGVKSRKLNKELFIKCLDSILHMMRFSLENFGEEYIEKYARKTKVSR